jgi:nuclear pore complex protein Nup54
MFYSPPRTVQKSIPEQMKLITEKWDPSNPNCVFKTYLYNKVEEHAVPHYAPGPNDDPKQWEEALQQKPAPNYIPVLCAGFPSIVARLVLQRRAISEFNNKLHAINASLDAILSRHDLEHSVRALNARRRHADLSKRCLALASRVQVLRNRGYALSSDEDELRQKLQKIDKGLQDPALSARMEELWSRLIVLRGHADSLKDQINKPGFADSDGMGEEIEAKAKKVSDSFRQHAQPRANKQARSWKTTRSSYSISKSRLTRRRRILRSGNGSIIRPQLPHRLRVFEQGPIRGWVMNLGDGDGLLFGRIPRCITGVVNL